MTLVPIFPNNPLYESQSSPKPSLTLSNLDALNHAHEDLTSHSSPRVSDAHASGFPVHLYQTQFSHSNIDLPPSLPPIAHPAEAPILHSVSLDPAFHGSRPDPLPPQLHPANNPVNPFLTNNKIEPLLHDITPNPHNRPNLPLFEVTNTKSITAKQHHHHNPTHISPVQFKPFKQANINLNLRPFPPFRRPSLAHSAPIRPHHHLHPNHHQQVSHPHSLVHHPSLVGQPPLFHHPSPVHHPTSPLYSTPPQSFTYDPFEFQQKFNKSLDNQLEPQPPAARKPPPPSPPSPLTPVALPPPPPNITPFPPVLLQPTPGNVTLRPA